MTTQASITKSGILLPLIAAMLLPVAAADSKVGIASWYGEAHRGRFMANGQPFDPDALTAASWFFPLGAMVEVSLRDGNSRSRKVVVTITDRGPARRLVKEGRIIDLSRASFEKLAPTEMGLVQVCVRAIPD